MGLLEELLGSSAQSVSHQQASGLAQNVLEMLQQSGGPVFIDKLTPTGQSPPPSSLMQMGLNVLKQLK